MTSEIMAIVSMKERIATVVNQIFKEQVAQEKFGPDTQTDTNITVKLISDPTDGLQFKFKINIHQEGRDDLDLFAKYTKVTPKWENLILKPYQKERLFYTSLVKIYRQLEDKHVLIENDKLRLPVCYGAESASGEEIMVLEDLTSRGFSMAPSWYEPLSWTYATAAITELAKFHALSMAFQHESPSEFETLTTQLPSGLFEKNEGSDALVTMFKSLAMKAVSRESEKKLNAFFESGDFVTTLNNFLKPLNRKVITHGHFWPKNMMHKVLDGDSVEVILLDYGTIQTSNPVTDLIHFIFTATDNAFRVKHCDELIDLYRSELAKATARLGLDLEQEYSNESFVSEFNEKMPFGLYAALAYLSILLLDDRDDRARGIPVDDETYRTVTGLVYQKRLNEIVNVFLDDNMQDNQNRCSKRCGMCFIC